MRAILVLGAFGLVGLLVPAIAQDVNPTFRVESEAVVLDLLAFDKQGRFVADLRPTDIEVSEDGKSQDITVLRLIGGPVKGDTAQPSPGSATAGILRSQDGTLSPGVQTKSPAPPIRDSIALVFDLLSMPPEAFPRVRESVIGLLRTEVPPEVPIMVATLTDQLTIGQNYTTDRGALIAALNAIPGSLSSGVVPDVLDEIDRLCAAGSRERVTDSALEIGKLVLLEANRRVALASVSLSALAESLGGLGSRKHLVLYSAGYSASPANQVIDTVTSGLAACTGGDVMVIRRHAAEQLGALATSAMPDGLRSVVDRANRAQVSFYTVDPRGATTGVVQSQHSGRSRIGSGLMIKFSGLNVGAGRDYLRSLAEETGGRSFFDTNDLGIGLRRAWQDGKQYYLVGYSPASRKGKGQFRRIRVKVRRSGVDILYRRGYYEATEHERAEDDIARAIQNPAPFDRQGFEVETVIDGRTLKIQVRVPPAPIRFSRDGSIYKADFSVHGELRDRNGALVRGKPLVGRDIALRLNDERFAAIRAANNLIVWLDSPLPEPGKYTLYVAARDSGGWIAVRTVGVSISR